MTSPFSPKVAMALPSAFRERLEQMEQTRNQRIALLQAEKELQNFKSQTLASKQSDIRSIEHRCLKIDSKIASQLLVISSLKSELHRLDSCRSDSVLEIKALKDEVEEVKDLTKQRDCYYALEIREMEGFRAQKQSYVVNCRRELEQLRVEANELKSSFSKLQNSINYSNNSEIGAAEKKKCQLQCGKESMDQLLSSNIRIRDQLRKQLRMVLADQDFQSR